MKNIKNQLHKLDQAIERKNLKEQGFYDGRYAPRVVKDKKKEKSKNWARQKVEW